MDKWGVGWRWVTGRGDKSQQRAEGTDLPKTEVSTMGEKERVLHSSLRAFLYLLWMLVGHEAPLILSHHAPGHDQAISTSWEEMPLVKAQTLHGSLVTTESLQEKRALFSPHLQLRLWVLQRPKLEAFLDELQSHTLPIHDYHSLGIYLSWLYFYSKKASGVHASLSPELALPREGRMWSRRGLAPGGSVAGAGLIFLEYQRGPEFTVVCSHKV